MNALDQQITVFVGKLADAAPPPVEFERLAEPRTAGRRGTDDRRPLLAAAAIAMVLLGLVAVDQVRRSGDGSAVAPIVPGPTTVVGMPFAVVPAELPDGWRFVDLFDSGAGGPVERASSFLFRRQTTGAAIYVQTWPTTGGDSGPFRDLRESFDTTGSANFMIDDTLVWMRAAGIATDEAVALAESLALEEVGPDQVPRFPLDAGFELESSRSITDAVGAAGSVGQLRLRTPNGTVDVVLDARDPGHTAWNHYGVPTRVGNRTAYVSPFSVTGDPIGGVITAAVLVSDPDDIDAATRFFASLRRAPLEAWDEIEDRIAADLASVPVVDRIEIRDVSVTRHEDGATTAICARRQGTTRCRSDESPIWGGGSTEYANLVVDGLWVVAGTIDDAVLTRFEVTPADAVLGEYRVGDERTFFAYTVPAATHVGIEFDGTPTSGEFGFDRPAR